MGEVFVQELGFSPGSTITPLLHTQLHLHTILSAGQTCKAWEPSVL